MPANGAECVSVVVWTGLPLELDFHSNHGHPQSAGLHLPEGACFKSTIRVYPREFRESAVGLVLSPCCPRAVSVLPQCCIMVSRSA